VTSDACSHRDHVLLGDPVLDEPVRLGELERPDATVRGEVGIEDYEARLTRGELEKGLAVRGSDVFRRLASGDLGV
jgi:hypothetical protein